MPSDTATNETQEEGATGFETESVGYRSRNNSESDESTTNRSRYNSESGGEQFYRARNYSESDTESFYSTRNRNDSESDGETFYRRNRNFSESEGEITEDDNETERPKLSRTTSIERELADCIVRLDDIDDIKMLLALGANVNARLRHGLSPLHYAIWQNYIEAAKLLIDAGKFKKRNYF